jgi:hydrogenase maturation protein HypF
LFDAMAAALGICRGRQGYEGDAAARLEALAEDALTRGDHDSTYYPFKHSRRPQNDMLELDPAPLWHAVLDDLAAAIPATTMALRFHRGLARALVAAVQQLAAGAPKGTRVDTVVLSGGSFQNRILLESVASALQEVGFVVLSHALVPTNDGGLALGQAAIGAARLAAGAYTNGGVTTCA